MQYLSDEALGRRPRQKSTAGVALLSVQNRSRGTCGRAGAEDVARTRSGRVHRNRCGRKSRLLQLGSGPRWRHRGSFEPNPVLARFAQSKLGRRARLHEVALSDHEGVATLYVPRRASGSSLHIIGNLGNVYAHDSVDEIQVRLATLDSYGFENVGFLKIDVEGSEMEVLAGARETIRINRPSMLIELLAGIHEDHLARIEQIKNDFGYDAWIVIGREKFEAKQALAEMEPLRRTSNILFTPRS